MYIIFLLLSNNYLNRYSSSRFMSINSRLEKLMDSIELKVDERVEQYAQEKALPIVSSKKKLYNFGVYNPKSIDRYNYPLISLNGTCSNYKDSLDKITINLFQEYSVKLQESKERKYFDANFDNDKYESKVNRMRTNAYGLATGIAGVATTMGIFYLCNGNFDSRFSGEYVISPMVGFMAVVLESWFNPLGKLLMINYGKSKLLGTKQYEADLKLIYTKKIIKHLRKINPKNILLSPDNSMIGLCKN
jgi:hypothetical protein